MVEAFLKDYTASVDAANNDLDGTAALCEEQGVVGQGSHRQGSPAQLQHRLVSPAMRCRPTWPAICRLLYDADPAAVGGAMPDDAFYWMGA